MCVYIYIHVYMYVASPLLYLVLAEPRPLITPSHKPAYLSRPDQTLHATNVTTAPIVTGTTRTRCLCMPVRRPWKGATPRSSLPMAGTANGGCRGLAASQCGAPSRRTGEPCMPTSMCDAEIPDPHALCERTARGVAHGADNPHPLVLAKMIMSIGPYNALRGRTAAPPPSHY